MNKKLSKLYTEADKYYKLSERYKDADDLNNARYYEGKYMGIMEAIKELEEKDCNCRIK